MQALNLSPVRFLQRKMTLKSVEHSLCEYFKFCRAAKEGGSTSHRRKYNPRVKEEVFCDTCQDTLENSCFQDYQECVLCSRAYHNSCLPHHWTSTQLDFWLCSQCHSIEAVKGGCEDTILWEANIKLWPEEKLVNMLKMKKVEFSPNGEICDKVF